MDADEYKKKLTQCLTELEKLGANSAEIAALKLDIAAERDPRKLVLMYQTLLEVIDKEAGGKGEAEFYIQTPDGVKLKARNLEEGRKIARDYGRNMRTTNQRRTD